VSKQAYFPGWNVIAGCATGIAFGAIPLFASGFALLSTAMAKDYGWTQPDVARAASIFLLCLMIGCPLSGWPLDRLGSRKFALLSIFSLAVSLIALSQVGNSLTQFYLAFALFGFVGPGTSSLSYLRAIALWFKRKRGLALGAAASAQAVGAFLVPILGNKGIEMFGWSRALCILAAIEVVVCLPVVAVLVKDSPKPYGLSPDGDEPTTTVEEAPVGAGMDVRDIIRTSAFWKLAISFGIMGMTFYAIAPNIVYILTKGAGFSLGQVAEVQAAGGIAVLFGRVGFGILLDKFHGPYVAMLSIVAAALSVFIYAEPSNLPLVLFGAVIGACAIGGESDLMPYLASRYFGVRSVSKIYAWFLFAFFIGSAMGPSAFAQISEIYHGATVPLLMLVAIQVIPAALFLSLGPYPDKAVELTPPSRLPDQLHDAVLERKSSTRC
jgi:MFS family permease